MSKAETYRTRQRLTQHTQTQAGKETDRNTQKQTGQTEVVGRTETNRNTNNKLRRRRKHAGPFRNHANQTETASGKQTRIDTVRNR